MRGLPLNIQIFSEDIDLLSATRKVAYEFYKKVIALRPGWVVSQYCEDEELTEEDKRLIKEMPKVNDYDS